MSKKIILIGLLIFVLAVSSACVANPAQAASNLAQPAADTTGRGKGPGESTAGVAQQTNLPAASGELSAEETAALLFMREEEKLAHDVYTALSAKWGLPVFANIAASEQTHTDAVKVLIERYGLQDPASPEPGVFTNPELQALYTELVARGSQSLAEAIKVGGAVEEIDILDLEKRLAQTDNPDIQQVFNNLLQASKSHLNAFARTLQTQTGETYQPQYLSTEAYQAIAAGGIGNGNSRGGNGARRGRP